MIQLTFQFTSIDDAAEFLRAVNHGPKGPEIVIDLKDAQANPSEAKRERKPRSDAGQPRGPYKRKEDSPAEAAAPATQTPAETPPAVPAAAASAPVTPGFAGDPPAYEPAVPAAADPTLADVRTAMTGRTTEKNIALLRKFGYAKSSDLPPAKYPEFIAACKRGE